MYTTCPQGLAFVRGVRPLIEQRDVPGLMQVLAEKYPHQRLVELLSSDDEETVKTALVCLALNGTMDDVPAVARMLHSPDEAAAGFAEHALWSIWFRAGGEAAISTLHQAVQLISDERYEEAKTCLGELIERRPALAEAYHQRAIVHFLLGDYAAAIEDCRQTLRLNPCHFGAMAGLGHCHAARGDLGAAEDAYRATLLLHPRLEGVRQSLQQIVEALPRRAREDGPSPSTLC